MTHVLGELRSFPLWWILNRLHPDEPPLDERVDQALDVGRGHP
jgi:hypothetical protein